LVSRHAPAFPWSPSQGATLATGERIPAATVVSARPYAVRSHEKRRRQRRGVDRVFEAIDCRRQARNLFDRRSWTRPHRDENKDSPKQKSRLFYLPPYPSDRNPDELAWKHLKAATVGGMVIAGRTGFQNKVWASMRQPQNDAGEIISFFQKPPLEYAA